VGRHETRGREAEVEKIGDRRCLRPGGGSPAVREATGDEKPTASGPGGPASVLYVADLEAS